MWKKDDRQDEAVPQRHEPPAGISFDATSAPTAAPQPAPAPVRAPSSMPTRGEIATIGRSITIRGDVSGDEDLLIQGRVEGSINLKANSVTIGGNGEVVASVVAKIVMIEGRVEGNINGGEQVVLRTSAIVKGDIRAPRVVLESGARFRGLVDMGEGVEGDQAVAAGNASRIEPRNATANGKQSTDPVGANGASQEASTAASNASASPSTDAGDGDSGKGSVGANAGKAKKPGDVEARLTA